MSRTTGWRMCSVALLVPITSVGCPGAPSICRTCATRTATASGMRCLRSTRDSPGAGTLNSDTPGQLTVTGTQPATDVVAIIFAPGEPLPTQNRVASPNTVASWLEGENANGDVTFDAAAPSSTFNDRLLVITRDMLMPAVEQRVARQARRCLENFAAGAGGRYPFAAPMSDVTAYDDGILPQPGPPPIYTTTNYGRIPSTLAATNAALGGTSYSWPNDDPQPGASVTSCFQSGTWWDTGASCCCTGLPRLTRPAPPAAAALCGTCLTVNVQGDVKFVVIVAGRMFNDSLTPPRRPTRACVPRSRSMRSTTWRPAPSPHDPPHHHLLERLGLFRQATPDRSPLALGRVQRPRGMRQRVGSGTMQVNGRMRGFTIGGAGSRPSGGQPAARQHPGTARIAGEAAQQGRDAAHPGGTRAALIGYAMINGRLPRPCASDTADRSAPSATAGVADEAKCTGSSPGPSWESRAPMHGERSSATA